MDFSDRCINKISPPRLKNIFLRERLLSRLDTALERPVVWVYGPGGSGKSTLVASYLDSRSLPCVWYQVDEGDADCATLFSYLEMAAKRASPRHRAPLPHYLPEHQLNPAIFARRYFEKFFSRLKPPFILVLDDYHEVRGESLFQEIIKNAIVEIPAGINVVIVSRQAPPPVMARFCAGRHVSLVGWDELRLSAEKLKAFSGCTIKAPICPRPSTGSPGRSMDGWQGSCFLWNGVERMRRTLRLKAPSLRVRISSTISPERCSLPRKHVFRISC